MKSSKTFVALLSLLFICCFLVVYFFAYAGNGKIVYVDSGKLLSGYKGMIDARKEFDKKSSAWKSNIDTLTKEVQDAIKAYSKNLALGTQKEKDLSKELISTKQKELINYQTAIKQNAAQEEQRLNQDVLNTINTFLLKYGKQQGYKMILVAANGDIAYADPSMEITDKVVDELNKDYTPTVK
jgi:outer membrane protein